MKRLLFVLMFVIPSLCFAQQQVTLNSGKQFEAFIRGVSGNNLTFYKEVQELNSKKVELFSVVSIAGELDKLIVKRITKKHPEILFDVPYIRTEPKEEPYQQTTMNKDLAGNYIVTAGKRYISGATIAIGGGILTGIGAANNNTELTIAGGALAIVGGIVSITGHFQLVKAGKKMNSDALTLSPADHGIGLSLNF